MLGMGPEYTGINMKDKVPAFDEYTHTNLYI